MKVQKRVINRQSKVNDCSGDSFTLSAFEAQLLLLVGEVSGHGSDCRHDDCRQDAC